MSKHLTNLSKSVYDYIYNQIMTKQLLPGERVPEKKIEAQFSVSRAPVRDALHKLEDDGLIEILPNRFAQVIKCNEKMIREVGMLRVFLDYMAIKVALFFGSDADFLELKKYAVRCETAAESNDAAKRNRSDCEFHEQLIKITQNPLLNRFQRELDIRILFIIINYPYALEEHFSPTGDHVALADALIARDENRAISIIMNHHIRFYRLNDCFPGSFFDFIPFLMTNAKTADAVNDFVRTASRSLGFHE